MQGRTSPVRGKTKIEEDLKGKERKEEDLSPV